MVTAETQNFDINTLLLPLGPAPVALFDAPSVTDITDYSAGEVLCAAYPDDEDEVEEDEDEDDEDEKPAKGKKSSKKDDSEPVKIRVTKELKAATRLRDVIEQLMGQGLKGAQLVNACKKLQDTLPVLKAIKDLETRVPRAASLVNSKK